MSIAAGRWRKIQAQKDVLPYLRYRSDHFRRTPRLDHQSWHGLILRVDNPWWLTHFPPNGWGCNCLVDQLSEGDLRRNDWTVGTAPVEPSSPFRTASGRIVQVPEGIDPGFGYNPGTAHLRVIADRAHRTISNAEQSGDIAAARRTLASIAADPAFDQFIASPELRFPVALLSDAMRVQLGTESGIAILSQAAALNQLAKDRGITMRTYRQLPFIEEAAETIAASEGKLIFGVPDGNRWSTFTIVRDAATGRPLVTAVERLQAPKFDERIATAVILHEQPPLIDAALITAFVDTSIAQSAARPLFLGRANSDINEVANYRRLITSEKARHIVNFHGADGIRNDRLPVIPGDFSLIPRIIADGLSQIDMRRRRSDAATHVLKIGDVYYIYIERIGRARRRLTPSTFYKTAQRPVWVPRDVVIPGEEG